MTRTRFDVWCASCARRSTDSLARCAPVQPCNPSALPARRMASSGNRTECLLAMLKRLRRYECDTKAQSWSNCFARIAAGGGKNYLGVEEPVNVAENGARNRNVIRLDTCVFQSGEGVRRNETPPVAA